MSKRNPEEMHGYQGQLIVQQQMLREVDTLSRMESVLERLDDADVFVTGMTLKCPNMEKPRWLAVVRAHGPDGSVVAFHEADTYRELVVTLVARAAAGTLKWKEDQYA